MKSFTVVAAATAAALLAGGCTLVVRHNPILDELQLRQSPPVTVAVLPFYNDTEEPMASAIARDALCYTLDDKGFKLLDGRSVDQKLSNPAAAASLRGPNGSINAQAAGTLFGTDAVAIGRVVRVKPVSALVVGWTRFRIQVWLVDTRTQKTLWTDAASVVVSQVGLPKGRRSPTPAEQREQPLLKLCRAFDAVMHRLARRLPSFAPEPAVSRLAIRRLVVRPARPVLTAGDRVEILAEATPGCEAQALLGTLDKAVALEEVGTKGSGTYRATYTVQPGDLSNCCRVTVVLASGPNQVRRSADPGSFFLVDAAQPDPPTGLYYETEPTGILLKWERPKNPAVTYYLVYRGEATSGGVQPLARPVANQFEDRTATHAGRYTYFIKAVDFAGNPSSSSAELVVDLPGAGPTTVGGKIEGEARWTAFGSPYRLSLDVDVTPGSRLIIEAGTRVDIPTGMEITVRGKVEATGRPDRQILIIGEEASRGFHVTGADAVLQASYVQIQGAQRGIEAGGGECNLDHLILRDNQVGLEALGARRMSLLSSSILNNRYGVVVGSNCEIRRCEFVQNSVGLRVSADDLRLERCLFDNFRLDVEKLGAKPLSVDNHIFWTADPSTLFRHLWGNVTCRAIYARRWWTRTPRRVPFEAANNYLVRGEAAAVDQQWEKALRWYEAALLQERNRDLIEKALVMYKQIVAAEGPAALARELEFCQSAVLAYPRDTKLLQHLAEIYFTQGEARLGREICNQLLRIEPNNGFAKKNLAAAAPNP